MPAPSPAYIVTDPPPLNRFTVWPYYLDEFPADTLFGDIGNIRPAGTSADPAPSPFRDEAN